jgi:hypothetical protein
VGFHLVNRRGAPDPGRLEIEEHDVRRKPLSKRPGLDQGMRVTDDLDRRPPLHLAAKRFEEGIVLPGDEHT